MGGKATAYNVERIPRQIYVDLYRYFLLKLKEHGYHTCKVPQKLWKETHGDLDIVVGCDDDRFHTIKHFLVEYAEGGQVVKNDNTYSFAYNHEGHLYQIDVETVREDLFESYLQWTDWNDLPAILGRLVQKVMGCKYRPHGLEFDAQIKNFSESVTLIDFTDQPMIGFAKLCKVLGLDFDAYYNQRFDTEEDIFRWIKNSDYFDPAYFRLENQTNVQRSRLSRRPMYMRFLEWVDKLDWPEYFEIAKFNMKNQPEWYYSIKATQARLTEHWMVHEKYKEAFNGELVLDFVQSRNHTLEKGPKFGELMQYLNTKLKFGPKYWFQILSAEEFKDMWQYRADAWCNQNLYNNEN